MHAFDKDCDDLIQWAMEKEGLLGHEELASCDLATVLTLAKQQALLESELTEALSEELERLKAESARLSLHYPETREHIGARLEDAEAIYAQLVKQLFARKHKIEQAQTMFVFLDEFGGKSLVELTVVVYFRQI